MANEIAAQFIEQLKESHGGNYFDAPDFTELTNETLYNTHFCHYDPEAEGYGYVRNGKKTYQGHWIVYWDGTGVFIDRGWKPDYDEAPGHYPNRKCAVRFYRFGCKHDYEHTRRLGNCYNEYKCSKCNHVMTVDSSD